MLDPEAGKCVMKLKGIQKLLENHYGEGWET